jgi:hypothetical protein
LIQIKAGVGRPRHPRWPKEKAMPIESIIVSALIVSMFVVFAAAVAYGQYQTRHVGRRPDAAAESQQQEAEQRWRQAA